MTSHPIRILLSEAASKHLDATGHKVFHIVAKDMSDARSGRWVIHLAPCTLATARQAEGVLLGTHKATLRKAPTSAAKATQSAIHGATPPGMGKNAGTFAHNIAPFPSSLRAPKKQKARD